MKRPPLFGLAVTTAAGLLLAAGPAAAETQTVVPSQGDSINEDTTPAPLLEPVRDVMMWVDVDPATVSPVVNSNKIFLNNCKPNGCVVRGGNGQVSSIDGATYQGTWNIGGTRTLTASDLTDAQWNTVVDCMKEVFSPFGVEITTSNPSPGPHFEIMIAGKANDLGMNSGILGVSPFSCEPFIPNSLVFAFQKGITQFYGSGAQGMEEICATAAQEVAHSFALDHVTDASDPLTYFNYSGRRHFKNAQVQCGSDCQGGTGPGGVQCTGTTGQNHVCACPNGSTILTNTQNSVLTIQGLFGNGTPTPPHVKITSPTLGAVVVAGFPVLADITDDTGVARAELYVDGALINQLGGSPWAFNAPATLMNGTHKVKVIGYDVYGTSGSDEVSVVIGKPCGGDSDCPTAGDVCLGGRCVAGPGVTGGLGSTCTSNPDCKSGNCATDSTGAKHCVESCVLGEGQCPDGFGCLEAGGTNGVCWPGFDDGTGGCCSVGTDGTGPMFLGGGVCGVLLLRRRRRR